MKKPKRVTVSYAVTEPMLVGIYWLLHPTNSPMTLPKAAALNSIIEALGYKPE